MKVTFLLSSKTFFSPSTTSVTSPRPTYKSLYEKRILGENKQEMAMNKIRRGKVAQGQKWQWEKQRPWKGCSAGHLWLGVPTHTELAVPVLCAAAQSLVQKKGMATTLLELQMTERTEPGQS